MIILGGRREEKGVSGGREKNGGEGTREGGRERERVRLA
jgi:hypothetical protein